MKKFLAMMLAVGMSVSLFACGSSGGEQSQAPETQTPAATGSQEAVIKKVALVTDVGTIDDESFNQGTWEGVKAWCEDNGVEYTYYQPGSDSTDARTLSITQAINEGANVVVMPGYLFAANVMELPEQYPDVYFIAIDLSKNDMTYDYETYYDPASNATCITFAEEQAGYLAGYAAVMDGYTKLGFLGGMAVPAVVRYGYGFIQGADDAASELGVNVEMNYTYGGQFFGDANITAKMEGWYQGGTEVVFACGGGIYTSAIEAALQNNGMVIGVDNDQNYIGVQGVENGSFAYNPFLTSAMKGLSSVTETALADLQAGKWTEYGGQFKNFSLNEGDYVGLPTAETSWAFKTFTVDQYEAVKAKIMDGSISIDNSSDTAKLPEYSSAITVKEIA